MKQQAFFEEILQKNKIKRTKIRYACFAVLEKQGKPLSAADIYDKLSCFDLASIYRTLRLFEKYNIVSKDEIGGEGRYCLSLVHKHHHAYCTECGYTEEIPCVHTFSLNNFSHITHNLHIEGICNNCQNLCQN